MLLLNLLFRVEDKYFYVDANSSGFKPVFAVSIFLKILTSYFPY